MGIEVFTHGNELILDSHEISVQDKFKKLIDKLIEHFDIGHIPDPQLIDTLYDSLSHKENTETDLLKTIYIPLPKSLKVFPRNHNQAL